MGNSVIRLLSVDRMQHLVCIYSLIDELSDIYNIRVFVKSTDPGNLPGYSSPCTQQSKADFYYPSCRLMTDPLLH